MSGEDSEGFAALPLDDPATAPADGDDRVNDPVEELEP
jgi:hypothetical protein